MKREYFFTFLIVLLCIFVVSCRDSSEADKEVESFEPEIAPVAVDNPSSSISSNDSFVESDKAESLASNASQDYWDGGEWTGQPVVSSKYGISLVAHELFLSCGLKDRDIEQVVEYHIRKSEQDPFLNESQLAREALNSEMSPMWARTFSAETLTTDVYKVSCSEINLQGN